MIEVRGKLVAVESPKEVKLNGRVAEVAKLILMVDGQRCEVSLWDELARKANLLQLGDDLIIDGKLGQVQHWKSRDGDDRFAISIKAKNIGRLVQSYEEV